MEADQYRVESPQTGIGYSLKDGGRGPGLEALATLFDHDGQILFRSTLEFGFRGFGSDAANLHIRIVTDVEEEDLDKARSG